MACLGISGTYRCREFGPTQIIFLLATSGTLKEEISYQVATNRSSGNRTVRFFFLAQINRRAMSWLDPLSEFLCAWMKMLNQKIIVSTHHISYFELSVDFRPLAIYTPWIALNCLWQKFHRCIDGKWYLYLRSQPWCYSFCALLFFLGSRAVHLLAPRLVPSGKLLLEWLEPARPVVPAHQLDLCRHARIQHASRCWRRKLLEPIPWVI